MNTTETFHQLHSRPGLLILPNAWDAGSARVIEEAGAEAIATSSGGVAWALGYPDGNVLSPKLLAALTARISAVIRVPLSVDVEAAYTDDPGRVPENLKPIIDAGAAGINVEDGEGTPELLARKIEQIRKTADALGVKLFINARTDVYLNEVGAPEQRVEETLSRAARYRAAGADGIFVPGLCEGAEIKAIAEQAEMPLNVMARPSLPSSEELLKLGVRRLSSGTAIAQTVWNHTAEAARNFLRTGESVPVSKDGMAYSKLQSLFGR